MGFSHFFPKRKSATTRRESSAPLGAHPSSWTPAAYELEEASKVGQYPGTWVDEQCRGWWKSDTVPGRWYLASSNESIFWDEPGKVGGSSRRR